MVANKSQEKVLTNKQKFSENIRKKDDFLIKRMKLMTVSAGQYEDVIKKHPALKENQAFRNFFVWLATYKVWFNENGNPIVRCQQIAACSGKRHQQFNTGEFLWDYKNRFCHDLAWNEFSYEYGLCRVITNDGISEYDKKRMRFDGEGKRVYVNSEERSSEKYLIQKAKEIQNTLSEVHRPYPIMHTIAEYLHGIDTKKWIQLRNEHWEEALTIAQEHHNSTQQVRLLHRFYDMPKPFYPPTINDNPLQARLFGTELCNIASPIRRTILKGMPEADIANAHFAILAALYPECMPETMNLLHSHQTIWNPIMEEMGIEQDEKVKVIIKPITYSLPYGRKAEYAQELLYRQLQGHGIIWKRDYLDCIYIKELVAATTKAFESIEKYGGMQGAFGWIQWDRKMDMKSFLANVLQTYELALIGPLYEMDIEKRKNRHSIYTIMLHSHDGVTVEFKQGKENEAMTQMKKCFAKVAAYYGILTELVFKK